MPPTVGLLAKVTLPDQTTLEFTYDSATEFGARWN